jgi:4-amino-4-deoxy-L-arabinose transferase-like glycosyltransferase
MSGDASAPAPETPARPRRRRLEVEEIVVAVLLGLSIIGIGITDFARGQGLRYWLGMVPIFAAASIFASWKRTRSRGGRVTVTLLQQVLHWGALALAVCLVYVFARTGRINNADAGLVALLALALTTFLAGVHFDWRLAVLGAVLGAAAACAALLEQFFWILLLPALAAGAVAVLWRRRGG